MDKQIYNLTIFLIKDDAENINDCLKYSNGLTEVALKSQFGLDGKIYFSESNPKAPRWKSYLEELSSETISIGDNTSNKAILLVKIKSRIMAVAFGYGRSFLKEDKIERNFGFKVALNLIDPNKMRSINAATIEDMVVNTQHQASYSTTQEEFGLNITNDIMKAVTGQPYDLKYGNHISGKDSLVVSVFMELRELKDKLTLYLDAFTKNRYKDIGFEWVDNVSEVRDSVLAETLDFDLAEAISKKDTSHLHIAPPETTDWQRVIGFCFTGMGKKIEVRESYELNIDFQSYLEKFRVDTNVYQKIKRDKLLGMNSDETVFSISSVYASLIFQTVYEGNTYILCDGTWYEINSSFFNTVHSFINNRIPISTVSLPNCPIDAKEAEYNKLAADSTPDFCLMDQRMVSVNGGPKKIEACDVFTKDKQLIHIKNKGQSSQLSHLFAQGKVSGQCFIDDQEFRKQVLMLTREKFSEDVFDYSNTPASKEFEIVYGIIDSKIGTLTDRLPFFSLVNLMLTAVELDRMHFKYSVVMIKRDD